MTRDEATWKRIKKGGGLSLISDKSDSRDLDIEWLKGYKFAKNKLKKKKQRAINVVLDKIRAEITGMYRVILKGTPEDDWAVRWNDCIDEVLQKIDKYRQEG